MAIVRQRFEGTLIEMNCAKLTIFAPADCIIIHSKLGQTRRIARVICLGRKDGPAISGTAEVVSARSEVVRVYRGYWRTHPLRMAIVVGFRIWIEMLLNKRVAIRVQPDEPNPLAGLTDPAI